MKISDLFIMGLRNLSRRKARTALTVIGVIIGTISIVVMVSIGVGMNKNYESQVMELGSLTTITVERHAPIMDEEGNYVDMKEQSMDDSLVEQIKEIKHVRAVSPVVSKSAMLTSGKYETYIQIMAMDSSTFEDFDFPALASGSYPTDENNKVMVMGAEIPNNFYDPRSRRWEPTTVDLENDKIIFRFGYEYMPEESKKQFSMTVTDYAVMEKTDNWQYDGNVYMDIGYFESLYKKYASSLKTEDRKKALKSLETYERIQISVDNVKNLDKVQNAIKEMGYQPTSLGTFLKPMQETSRMLQMVLGGIGAISMLVSAINIANTMVMSIYERTKEIGIMKVLGCFIRDIKKLFLFEAGIIGLMGGIIGIILSYITSWGINKFGQPLFKSLFSGNYMYNMENTKFSVIPIWLPFVAAGIAIVIGLVSGYYPARRATKISAIEAMKTDG
jgi:ABC-type antimicrobial peptide transport system permease subunit